MVKQKRIDDFHFDLFLSRTANINKLGHEDHIPGQVRDWNEELQITKELPKKTLPERLIRERAMFKVKRKTNIFHSLS